MPISDIYSKRQKKSRGEISDVYQYTDIPTPLKVQVIQIIKDSIGYPAPADRFQRFENAADEVYRTIHETLAREYGVFKLREFYENDFVALTEFFLKETDEDKCLDLIELSMRILEGYVATNKHKFISLTRQTPEDAISELNERFKEHGVGYQFESGEIMRIDSQIIHSEVVKPTLSLLNDEPLFAGANDEFLAAHENYRHKRYKDCLNDCLKSFESLMKAIHEKHQWQYNPNDTASKLVNSCLSKGLIPSYLQSQFTSLKTMLETGVATIRNKNSGHGQGTDVREVPEELASYMLHLTATNLLFLSKCEQQINH
ncbi:STM4504/CBY_0614 family protein [Pantoea agglomerans]|uniref:STM4504/CBY_0614 family protein n=1 Tax=Enterobacter agglomerans TaxID=549 RepID=UPI003C7D5BDE